MILYHPPFSRYPTLGRLYQNHLLRQALQKYVIDDFLTIKRLHVLFCAFVFLVVDVFAVDVDAAGAGVDGAGAVVHVDSMAGAGVGIFGPPAVPPPAKSCLWCGRQRMNSEINIPFDSTMGISYTEGSTLSVRLL